MLPLLSKGFALSRKNHDPLAFASVLIWLPVLLHAQNLVVNPGFEELREESKAPPCMAILRSCHPVLTPQNAARS